MVKQPVKGNNWFFVDESGDLTFYDRKGNLIVGEEGCSSVFILGFIETQDPGPLRRTLLRLKEEIVADPYFIGAPSVQTSTAKAFHAKDDLPEVREKVFRLIQQMEFSTQFVVARKRERVFRGSFKASENLFYDHLVEVLFRNVMHRFTDNRLYFAKRGSKDRQAPLRNAIQQSIKEFEGKWHTSVETTFKIYAETPLGESCLSIVDYMNWAVYRAFVRGEMRYYKFVESKVSLLIDLYDTANYPHNWYTRRNPFEISKASPL